MQPSSSLTHYDACCRNNCCNMGVLKVTALVPLPVRVLLSSLSDRTSSTLEGSLPAHRQQQQLQSSRQWRRGWTNNLCSTATESCRSS